MSLFIASFLEKQFIEQSLYSRMLGFTFMCYQCIISIIYNAPKIVLYISVVKVETLYKGRLI